MMETFNSVQYSHRAAPVLQQGTRPVMEPVITIEKLNHCFGKGDLAKQVLIDINLSIYPGEIVIMTGPSGSGKTTLLTLIGALRSVQDGQLKILGQTLNQASNRKLVEVRRNIGYIFQGHNLLPFMTARQNVRMSLALQSKLDRAQALQKVDQVLSAEGLGNHLNYYPDKLSGGQKQRVAIARALVNEPALILADEPTASLDSKTGREVVELMYRLAKEQHCTIVLVTHDNRILDIADRIINLEDGRLLPTPEPTASLSPTPSPVLDMARSPMAEPAAAIVPSRLWVPEVITQAAAIARAKPALEEIQNTYTLDITQVKAEALPVLEVTRSPMIAPASPISLSQSWVPEVVPEAAIASAKPAAEEIQNTDTLDILKVEADENLSTTIDLRLPLSSPPDTLTPHFQSVSLDSQNPLPLPFPKDSTQPSRRYKIACIDDSPTVLCSLRVFLSDDLFSVYLIDDPIKSLIQLIKINPDMVILDINMPRLDGYQLCALLRQHEKFKHIPVIVITGDPKAIDLKIAQKVGVTECLVKPFDRSDLMVKLFPYLI